jgi:hypothetical protein
MITGTIQAASLASVCAAYPLGTVFVTAVIFAGAGAIFMYFFVKHNAALLGKLYADAVAADKIVGGVAKKL